MTDLTEQWVNIYKSKKNGSYWSGAFCYKTKEEAVKDLADKENYLTTVNIEDMLNLQTQNKQLKEYERIVTSYNMKPIDYDIAFETVNKLLDDNKRLKQDVGNLGYKIKNQRKEIEKQTKQNAELKETNEALNAELKEVCDVLIRKCPEMKEWVMLNWKNLYEVQK